MFVHIEIKSNQNGLVTLYTIFFVFNRRKSFGTTWGCFTVKCFSMWQKSIIKFVVFIVNSVISISVRFCPVLFIHLFTPIEGPMIHQNIQGGICGPDGLDLVHVILRGPHRKFRAQDSQRRPWVCYQHSVQKPSSNHAYAVPLGDHIWSSPHQQKIKRTAWFTGSLCQIKKSIFIRFSKISNKFV